MRQSKSNVHASNITGDGMIDIYTSPTGNGRRATIALAECGLPYRVHHLDLTKGEQLTAEFLKINPAAAIPAIVDVDGPGGKPIMLAQSGAIMLYCAEKSGKFLPKDSAVRAVAMQWFMQAVTDMGPGSSMVFYSTQATEKSSAITSYFEQRLMKMFAVTDARLAGRDYLADEISIADLALYPVALARKGLIDADPGLAALKAWQKRMAARPAIIKALADNG
jgi:GSH-dependent disulfide-bond oxidoreductase